LGSLNFLVAIPYLSEDVSNYLKTIEKDCCLLLDSGAFTYWKKGKEVPLNDYINFISNLQIKPWRYFTLDVIGNQKKTKQNYESLIKEKFNPIPIFTRGDNPSSLKEYYATSDLVGVGGLVGTPGNRGFVKGIMESVGSRKVHWLGFTQNDFLVKFKPFSCDSSSWSMALRYGTLDLYLGNGQWKRFSREQFKSRPSDKMKNLFAIYEEDPLGFRFENEWRNTGRSGADKKLLARVAYKAWAWYQLDVEQKLGVKFFLACGELAQFWLFYEAYLFWKKRLNFFS
jgi:hypothetical protein